MLQAEEELLVLAAQRGNHKAFSVLFKHHQQALVRFAYKLSHNQDIAQEATQDTWIQSAKNLHKLTDPRAFKSWLYRLARWRTLDMLKRQSRQQAYIDDDADEQALAEQCDAKSTDPQPIRDAIERLPAIEKQMIHLFYLDELSVAEIGIVLEIPTGTVKSRLNRARSLLKEKYRSE
ncbi:sigma-70 family RNA polymerase sigma factor [Alteromonadaceae bacterium BrNp21-10]|nr:sigma-70 family RNA polymerase sigma factor [Alteromonadaceae bacterium BrNp21-10]